MKILVLGGEGQIGKPVCDFLKSKKIKVISFDIKNNSFEDLRKEHNGLEVAINSCDFVYYFASDVGGAKYLESKQDSFDFIKDNLLIMLNVFSLLKKYNKPFIFTSSQMAQQSHSTYGNLKLIGERFTKSLGGMYVRLWNVYGKEENNEKSHVITDFIHQAKTYGKIKCRTNGEEERQFLHVLDLCECLLTLTKNYDNITKEENIDISSFEWVKIKNIAEICKEIFNCEIELSNKYDATQKNYKNDPKKEILEIWNPKINIREGILSLINE